MSRPFSAGLASVVGTAPVGYDDSVEPPAVAQDSVEQPVVMAAVLMPYPVVGAHDGPRSAVGDPAAESGQIDFEQGAVGERHIDIAAPFLLIVEGKMLQAGSNAVALDSADIRDGELSGKKGSSPIYSKLRPLRGVRQIFTPGPSNTSLWR